MIRSVLSCRYKTVEYLLKGFFVIAVLYFSFFTHEILAEASTARQIKTIEYSFGNTLTATTSSTTILYATDSGVGSGMGWSTSTPTLASQGINYQIHGSNIRIVDAWVEFRAVTSNAGDLRNISFGLSTCPGSVPSCGSSPVYEELPALGNPSTVAYYINSGEQNIVYVRADATAALDGFNDTQWTTGIETLLRASTTGTAALGNQTAKLYITYESDYSTTAHTEIKTVRFPLNATSTNDEGSRTSSLAAGTPQPFSYTADIPDAISDASIMDVYFEIHGQVSAAATNGNITAQINTGSTSPNVRTLSVLGDTSDLFMTYRPPVDSSNFQRNTLQYLKLTPSTNAIQVAGGELVVTYKYETDAPVQTETIKYMVGQSLTSNSTASSTYIINPVISNGGTSLKHAYIRAGAPNNAATTLTLRGDIDDTGGATARSNSYTLSFTGGEQIGTNRIIYDMSQDVGSFVSGGPLRIESRYHATGGDPVSLELFLTFTWSGDSGGTQTKTVEYSMPNSGHGVTAGTTADVQHTYPMNLEFPEEYEKTLRSAYVQTEVISSDTTSPVNVNAGINTSWITAGGTGFLGYVNTAEGMSFYMLEGATTSVSVASTSQTLNFNIIADASPSYSMKTIVTYDVAFTEIAAGYTLSGTLYSDEGYTPIASLVPLVVTIGTSTVSRHLGTTTAVLGTYNISIPSGHTISSSTPILIFTDATTSIRAALFTKASNTNSIANLDLYQNTLVISHEGSLATSTTMSDLAFYDNDNDADITYIANGTTLNLLENSSLYVKRNKNLTLGTEATTTHFTNYGTTTAPSGTFKVQGDFKQYGNFIHNGGTVTVSSSSRQTLYGNLATSSPFSSLVMDGVGVKRAGEKWSVATNTGFEYIHEMIIDQTNGGIVYIGMGNEDSHSIYRCHSNMDCTSTLDTGAEAVVSFVIDEVNNVLYAGAGGGVIYRCPLSTSCDAGGDFAIATDTADTLIHTLTIDTNNNVLYAGSNVEGQIYRCVLSTSCDGVGDFAIAYDSSEFNIYSLEVDNTNGVLYAGSAENGIIYRCLLSTGCDASGDFTTAYDTVVGYIESFEIDERNGVLYIAGDSFIYRCLLSTGCDASGDFSVAFSSPTSNAVSPVIDVENNVLYLGTNDGGFIYRCNLSTNCDESADYVFAYDTETGFASDLVIDEVRGVIYAGGFGGSLGVKVYTCILGSQCDAKSLHLTDLTTNTGSTLHTPGTVSLSGSYTQNGTTSASSTSNFFFTGGSTQTLSGTLTGTSSLPNVTLSGAGTKVIATNASTTGYLNIESSTSLTAPSGGLTVAGNFTQSGTFTHNSGTLHLAGLGTVATGTLTGSSALNNVSSVVGASMDVFTTAYDTSETGIRSLKIDTVNGVIYAGSNPEGIIYRCVLSTDCDAAGDFTAAYDTSETDIYSLEIDTVNGVLYAGSKPEGIIYRCLLSSGCDASGDFTTAYDTSESDIQSLIIDNTNNVLYAGSGFGGIIYRCILSTGCDASGDFTVAYHTPRSVIRSFTVDTINGVLYAGTDGAIIYRCLLSTGCDAGGDFTTVYDTVDAEIYAMAHDSQNGVLYVGSGDATGIIYRCPTSTGCDESGDFTVGYDTAEYEIRSLVVDQTNGVLYAGTYGETSLIYRCPTSTRCNESSDFMSATNTADMYIYSLGIDSQSGTLYGGTGEAGLILRRQGGPVFGAPASTTNLTIGTGKSLTAPASNTLSISGNYTNSGAFIANNGTTTFNGVGVQTATGTMSSSSAFYNLEIGNASTTIFGSALTVSNNFLAQAPSSTITFAGGATTTFNTARIVGTSGNTIKLRSTLDGTQFNFDVNGVYTIDYTDVKDSNACPTGTTITNTNTTDSGNNTCWGFLAAGTVVLSGTIYSDEGSTPITALIPLKIAIGTSTPSVSATTSLTTGDWSAIIPDGNTIGTSTPILIFTDATTSIRAALFTKASNTNSIANLDLYQNTLVISHEGTLATSTTMSDLAFYDNDNDSDITYTANGTTLNLLENSGLYVQRNKNLTLGTEATTTHFTNRGTTTAPTGNFTIQGHYINNGTFINNSGTTTFSTTTDAWNVSSSSTSVLGSPFSVASEEISPASLVFRPDGLRMYVMGSSGFDINTYSLTTPWDVSTASVLGSPFSVASQEAIPYSLVFRPDGLRMYVMGIADKDINTYTLSSPWDVSTASVLGSPFSVAGQETTPISLVFRPDGLRMYVMGQAGRDINTYALTTPWEVSTAAFLGSPFTVAAQDTAPNSLVFRPDGLRMYVMGSAGDDINAYSLATPWDVLTASFLGTSFSVSAQETTPISLVFRPDGLRMYVMGFANDSINTYAITGGQYASGTMTGTSAFNNVSVATGSLSFLNNASTSNLTIGSEAIVTTLSTIGTSSITVGGNYQNNGLHNLPSNNLYVGGSYTNNNTTLYNGGTTTVSGSSAQIISGNLTATSTFAHVAFTGAGTKTFNNAASSTNFVINAGAVVVAPPTNLSISGSYTNNGTFTHNSGTTTFSGNSSQTATGTMIGTSAFNNVTFTGSSTKTFLANASTSNFIIGQGATVTASTLLSIAGNYSNSGVFTAGSGTTTFNGTSMQTATGTMTGTSAFRNLTIVNTSGAGSTSQSIVFRAPASTTENFTMIGSTSAQFMAGATSTFTNISLQGTASEPIFLRSSVNGAGWGLVVPGAQRQVTYVNVRDSQACGGNPNISAVDGTSMDAGNNTCWDFTAPAVTTIASEAHQVFALNQSATPLSTITVTDGTTPSITAANDIRIKIATSTIRMLFDTTDTTATFGGTASAKVSNPVTYEGNGSVLVIPVSNDFSASDTLTISGLAFTSFTATNTAATALRLYTDGAGDISENATDSRTVAITGSLTLADHTLGQVSDAFLYTNQTGVELFRSRLTAAGEPMTITTTTFALEGVYGIRSDDLTNFALFKDNNSDGLYDVGDTQIGGSGAVSVTAQTGVITFSTPYSATTSYDYILVGDVANLGSGDFLTIKERTTSITATGDLTLETVTLTGAVTSVQHMKGDSGGGGSSPIGGHAPAGEVRTGGEDVGGDEIDSNTNGQVLGNEPGFNAPTSNGTPVNGWTDGSNAYVSDGLYATAGFGGFTQSYANFGFSIPENNEITGIEVRVEGADTGASSHSVNAELSWNGGSNFTNGENSGTFTFTDSVRSIGGQGELWGRTWTPAEFNNGNFILNIINQVSNIEEPMRIDAIKVRVYHQATGGGGGGGGEVSIPSSKYYANIYGAFQSLRDVFLPKFCFWGYVCGVQK